ncbi:MAG TPA: hypothetical protein VES97_10360 [Solirubrobacteraceae bacterium]|nr:hypothetical protein [Solirubrobacteraceae bacterium]
MRVHRHSQLRVVLLPLTHSEWNYLDELARLRGVPIEELLREGLRLPPLDAPQTTPERHLRVVEPEPVG